MLFGGRDGKREATAMRSLGLRAHSSSVCSHNTSLCAQEVAGHFPFVSVPGFYKLMYPFLADDQRRDFRAILGRVLMMFSVVFAVTIWCSETFPVL